MDPAQVSVGDALALAMNGGLVALFGLKFLRVAGSYRARAIDFYQLLNALVFLAAALSLAIASMAIRFVPVVADEIVRIDVAFAKFVLLVWLIVYWRRP
jgi:hypothetical protein